VRVSAGADACHWPILFGKSLFPASRATVGPWSAKVSERNILSLEIDEKAPLSPHFIQDTISFVQNPNSYQNLQFISVGIILKLQDVAEFSDCDV